MVCFKAEVYRHQVRRDGIYSIKRCVIHNRKKKYIATNLIVTKDDITKGFNLKNYFFIDKTEELIKKYRDIFILFLFSLLFCIIPCFVHGQVWDDFNDGTLKTFWLGDRDSFMVNSNFQLQLNATVAGRAYLSAPMQLLSEDMVWSFRIRENFAPSDNNLTRFYLMSDSTVLTDTALNGYYLRFGENLGNDAVRMFLQQGSKHTLICSATEGAIAAAFDIKIKITRTTDGIWTLSVSKSTENIYTEEFTCTENTFTNMSYTGLMCLYTGSNSTKFYFDDIYCGKIITDTLPPVFQSINVDKTGKQRIEILFDEPLDSSVLTATNFNIDNAVGNPQTVEFATGSFSKVVLHYANPFPANTFLHLEIKGISDLAGNIMQDTLVSFLLYEPQLFDIVINEIMAKPTPAVSLPEAEYIELYNRTPFPINLNAWKLAIGNSTRTFGNAEIAPYGYLLVTGNSNQGVFEQYGDVAYLSSLQITDAGQTFRLTDNNGTLIHFVAFTQDWYGDKNKSAGGWSIEMIDCQNPCGEMENWSASTDKKGGTPCAVNSVAKRNLDKDNPKIAYIASDSATQITVFFSEKMLPQTLYKKTAYSITPKILIDSILYISSDLDAVSLSLASPLAKNTIYTLYIKDTLTDCAGNIVALNSSVTFGLGEQPEYNDLVINEILFHPFDDGVNFVEIYNRSNKLIDFRNMRLSTYKKDGSLDTGKLIIGNGFQLFPQEYLVLTTQPQIVQSQYFCPNEQNFIKMNAFPTYNHGSGSVALINRNTVIDSFFYNEDMHYPLLKSHKGVSLERINPNRKTQDNFNWHSAASTVGYATPAYKNSSYSDNLTEQSDFEVYPEIFSPDNDGYNDVVNISYTFPAAGYRASIYIYNANGQKLKTLVNNQLLDTEGFFTWDGTIDGNIKAAVGTYIFLIEYWNTKGEVKRVKKTCTLAIKYR